MKFVSSEKLCCCCRNKIYEKLIWRSYYTVDCLTKFSAKNWNPILLNLENMIIFAYQRSHRFDYLWLCTKRRGVTFLESGKGVVESRMVPWPEPNGGWPDGVSGLEKYPLWFSGESRMLEPIRLFSSNAALSWNSSIQKSKHCGVSIWGHSKITPRFFQHFRARTPVWGGFPPISVTNWRGHPSHE